MIDKYVVFRLIFILAFAFIGYVGGLKVGQNSTEKAFLEQIETTKKQQSLDVFLYEKTIEDYKDTLSKTRHETIEIAYNLERERATNRTLIESIRSVNRYLDSIRPIRDSTAYR